MILLKWFSSLFLRLVEVKSFGPYIWKGTPYFYSESIDCLESLLSDNCCEWHSGPNHYRVFKEGIDKLKAKPDDIFDNTYVYKATTRKKALLKAINALSTKENFKNKKKLKIPEDCYN